MVAKRAVALLGISILCLGPLLGCAPKEDGVDKPLTPNAGGPPPARPDKPEISPSGSGGTNPK